MKLDGIEIISVDSNGGDLVSFNANKGVWSTPVNLKSGSRVLLEILESSDKMNGFGRPILYIRLDNLPSSTVSLDRGGLYDKYCQESDNCVPGSKFTWDSDREPSVQVDVQTLAFTMNTTQEFQQIKFEINQADGNSTGNSTIVKENLWDVVFDSNGDDASLINAEISWGVSSSLNTPSSSFLLSANSSEEYFKEKFMNEILSSSCLWNYAGTRNFFTLDDFEDGNQWWYGAGII